MDLRNRPRTQSVLLQTRDQLIGTAWRLTPLASSAACPARRSDGICHDDHQASFIGPLDLYPLRPRSCRYVVVSSITDSPTVQGTPTFTRGWCSFVGHEENEERDALVLHRDIFWLGKQWAVTGYGVQAIDRRLEMKFDIEASRIWDDHLAEQLQAEPWFDAGDFAEALALARTRAQEAPLTFQPAHSDERGEAD